MNELDDIHYDDLDFDKELISDDVINNTHINTIITNLLQAFYMETNKRRMCNTNNTHWDYSIKLIPQIE